MFYEQILFSLIKAGVTQPGVAGGAPPCQLSQDHRRAGGGGDLQKQNILQRAFYQYTLFQNTGKY